MTNSEVIEVYFRGTAAVLKRLSALYDSFMLTSEDCLINHMLMELKNIEINIKTLSHVICLDSNGDEAYLISQNDNALREEISRQLFYDKGNKNA